MGAARWRGAGGARPQRRTDRRRTGAAAAAGIAEVNPAISGVVEVFDDAVAAPEKNGINLKRAVRRPAFLMKDLGPTMQGACRKWARC